MAEPQYVETQGRRNVTLNGTVSKGDLLAHNGTNWVRADASDATLPAQLVALWPGVSGDVIEAAPWVLVEDIDAPYTQDGLVYLSETAGAATGTRPTTAGSLRQVVGSNLTDARRLFNLGGFTEVIVPWNEAVAATSAVAALDSGNWSGSTLDAQNETQHFQQTVPENAVGVVKSVLVLAAEATAGTPVGSFAVSSAISGEQHDDVTADTATGLALEGSAADEVVEISVSGALDGTNIVRPGAQLHGLLTKTDAGTDISIVFGGYTVYKVTR